MRSIFWSAAICMMPLTSSFSPALLAIPDLIAMSRVSAWKSPLILVGTAAAPMVVTPAVLPSSMPDWI
ncbi:hypothetical protein D3C85_1881010 [compost metagenome]